ncbi:uncharacterized protein A4U43_C05F9740 [Asparagus officinalis]|uniref:TNase-like domain-containing protein n=1 Tax=Asparagus officinalis TaxID=4686 RepID=A0A5P1ERK5_ASPOF|nr:uncharacterized protein A4U43_C05F9740 [Asparagus officinalis]
MVFKNLRDDEYLLYVAICMVGLPVEVQVKDGSLYSGILHTDSFDKNCAPSPNSWASNFMWSYDNPFLSDTASAKKAIDFLPFLQKIRRLPAMVEYVLSGHRFKFLIPKETCSIAFTFSGVRCPGRDEPFSDEAIALMRRKIMQREVEIEVETVDRAGTFLGSLWESKTNMVVALLQAGLAKLQNSFASVRIPDAHLLARAEQSAI